MVKGIKVSSWIDGMDDSIAVGTYNSNSPVSKLVEDVRHSIAEYLLQQPKAHGRNMRIKYEFEDGMFLEYGVVYNGAN